MATESLKIHSIDHALTTPIRNFSKERYISRNWNSREWQQVWRRHWLLAGLARDVANSGEFFVFDIGNESIIISCDSNGKLHAFYNACKHRGLRLTEQCRGQVKNFRCPYHSWRYSQDGSLLSVPDPDSFSGGVPRDQLSLHKVRCEVRLGFVWINMSDEGESLEDYLQDLEPHLLPFDFSSMQFCEDQTVAVDCNWKAVIDNFSELYHVHHIHPQHRRFTDCTAATSELYPRGHSRLIVPGGTTDSRFPVPDSPTDIQCLQLSAVGLDPEDFDGRTELIRDALIRAKRRIGSGDGFNYANYTDEQLADVYQINVFPNIILSYQPELLWVMRARPHPEEPGKCYLDKLSFSREGDCLSGNAETPKGGTGRPEHDAFSYEQVISGEKTMTDTIDQDLSLLAHAQKGMLSAGFEQLWLSDIECRIAHYHQRLDECMNKE